MKITVEAKTTKEVEVTFPIYRKHRIYGDDSDTVILARINDDLTYYEITKRDGSWRNGQVDHYEFETGKYTFDARSGEDYSLGKGEYASSKEEWDRMVEEAVAALVCYRS